MKCKGFLTAPCNGSILKKYFIKIFSEKNKGKEDCYARKT